MGLTPASRGRLSSLGPPPPRGRSAARRGRTPALPKTLRFLQLLWAVNQGLEIASKAMARRLGVTGPQRFVIRLIGRLPGISAGEIAATLRSDPSTLTGVLQRLESRSLVARVRDAADGRRVLFRLTQRGRSIDGISAGTIEQAVRTALGGASAKDLGRVAGLLRRIESHLFELGGTGAREQRAVRAGRRR